MSPKEIIRQLALLGVKITERTLYNYSEWNLIPTPKRGSGRSGKWVEYPDEAMAEAYAAWRLLHGDYWAEYKFALKPPKLSPETVATIRRVKLEIDTQDWSQLKRKPANLEESVRAVLFLTMGVSDIVATAFMCSYINLWKLFVREARSRVAEILNDPEY